MMNDWLGTLIFAMAMVITDMILIKVYKKHNIIKKLRDNFKGGGILFNIIIVIIWFVIYLGAWKLCSVVDMPQYVEAVILGIILGLVVSFGKTLNNFGKNPSEYL